MNVEEYNKIKNFTYQEYCDYLVKKYGPGLADYMTSSYNKNKKCSRTQDGLVVHHRYEDHAIMLSHKEFAMKNPFEWQQAKNMVYCDYLEHLFLHILICEYPSPDRNEGEAVGIGGVINFIVPELNDFYSGWRSKQEWKIKMLSLIENDMDVYLELLKRFKHNCYNYPTYTKDCLFSSLGNEFGVWNIKNNRELFEKIKNL